MIKVKEEKIERATNYVRVMRELTMLGSFIRLADYMFVEGKSYSHQAQSRAAHGILDRRPPSTLILFFCHLCPLNLKQTCAARLVLFYFPYSPHPTLITGMIDRAVTSAEELLTLLSAPKSGSDPQQGKQSKGIFLTTISFLPAGISFAPDTSAVLEELNGTIESVISIAQQVGMHVV